MNTLDTIKLRFRAALADLTDDPDTLLAMIRPTQDDSFGDYQANCAMPLGKKLGKAPRDIATDLLEKVELTDLCSEVEVAGPGFINLTLSAQHIKQQLNAALADERLGVALAESPRTVVVDYSSPNVAKPMHVGHIRSTVIGDALARIHRFLGHKVITDNHLGDWGTQFGMIIYGYKHFVDRSEYEANPVLELSRLYKLVRRLMDFHGASRKLPEAQETLEKQQQALERIKGTDTTGDKAKAKQRKKDINRLGEKISAQTEQIQQLGATIEAVEADAALIAMAGEHASIEQDVLTETVKLHAGDEENRALWDEFLPYCLDDINRLYKRLNVEFDYTHGESFYHDQLAGVVEEFISSKLAVENDGAICVFLDGYDAPMIIRKKDGAYLYPTSDLATIQYRVNEWQADTMLYVVDHRQGDHFDKLFDAAKLWGYTEVEMTHVSFGTVLGDDGKPFKTRAGDTVGLEGLLDEAESRALEIATEQNPDLDPDRQKLIGRVVGIGALKYADLSQNRSSDYKFSYDKMLALRGNTATYLQYANARVHGILRNLDVNAEQLRAQPVEFVLDEAVERQLALKLMQFDQALADVLIEYKPNLLCNYLFDLAQLFARFFDQCSVRDAGSDDLQRSRLQLCDLTARSLSKGLELLGIETLERI